MILTNQATSLIEVQLAENPLKEGEVRRMEGMGNLFVTAHMMKNVLSDGEIHVEGMVYWFLYALRISGVTYYFYGGEPLIE